MYSNGHLFSNIKIRNEKRFFSILNLFLIETTTKNLFFSSDIFKRIIRFNNMLHYAISSSKIILYYNKVWYNVVSYIIVCYSTV